MKHIKYTNMNTQRTKYQEARSIENRISYQNNREARLEYQRDYYEKNKEKIIENNRLRRERLKGLTEKLK